MKSIIRKPRSSSSHTVSALPTWQVLRTQTGWVHLPEGDTHLAKLKRLYTQKVPGQCVVLLETGTQKLVIKCGNFNSTFTLTEFDKKNGDNFQVKRVSLVRPGA